MKKILIAVLLLVCLVFGFAVWKFGLIKLYKELSLNDEITTALVIEEGLNEDIVFFNAANIDRRTLANLISRVGEKKPAVIALDLFFTELKDKVDDDFLSKTIANNPVVLAIQSGRNEKDRLYYPTYKFRKGAKGIGVAAVEKIMDFSWLYKPYHLVDKDTIPHFSIVVAQLYAPEAVQKFKDKIKVNQDYYIPYKYTQNNFKVLNSSDSSFTMQDIEGKIVLFGFLGPGMEDKHATPVQYAGKEIDYTSTPVRDMYGSFIQANQILGILNGEKHLASSF